jgi:hypothetical protein
MTAQLRPPASPDVWVRGEGPEPPQASSTPPGPDEVADAFGYACPACGTSFRYVRPGHNR